GSRSQLPQVEVRVPIPPGASRHLTQRVFRCLPGDHLWWMKHGAQEDVLYVASGRGRMEIEGDDRSQEVRRGSGVLIPPGNGYRFKPTNECTIVSILAPSFDVGGSPKGPAIAEPPI